MPISSDYCARRGFQFLFAATLTYLQQLLFVWNNNIFLFAVVFINFPWCLLLFVRAFTNLQQHLCILRNVLLFLHQDIFVYIHVYLFAPIYICLQLSPVGHRRNDTLKVVKKWRQEKHYQLQKHRFGMASTGVAKRHLILFLDQ